MGEQTLLHEILKRQPTIKEIAEVTGLHYQTVRKVLLGIEVGKEAKRKVQEAIVKLFEADIKRKREILNF